jgi:hypothetical protein
MKMKHSEKLYVMLTEEILPEIHKIIKQMDDFAVANEITEEMREELGGIHAMEENFVNIVQAIEQNVIEEKNCEELINEINMMRQMSDEGASQA